MRYAVMAALAALVAGPSAIDGPEYSFSEGTGTFYALRHSPSGREPYEEVVGSAIAMNRARTQAREGGYTLEIKGPFGGVREASAFIQKEWDPDFGRPRKPTYAHSPAVPGTAAREARVNP